MKNLYLLIFLAIAACGGGGGGGNEGSTTVAAASTTAATNNAPVINSAASYSVLENQTTVGTASATDSDSISLIFTLTGADANALSINSINGAMTFNTAPDYETKNSYAVTLNVSDGTLSATKDLTINITDDTSDNNNAPIYSGPQNNTITMNENILIIPELTLLDTGDDNLTVNIFSSRGYKEDLDTVLYNIELGNSDGTTKVISSDLSYTSSDIIKLVSDVQLAQSVRLTLNGVKIYSTSTGAEKKIEVYNGHLDISDSKLRNIGIGFERMNSSVRDKAGSIKIIGSNWIAGTLANASGYAMYGSYEIKDNYFQDISYGSGNQGAMYFWYPTNKFIFERNSLINSGGISLGYSISLDSTTSGYLKDAPIIKNNFFAHKDESNSSYYPSGTNSNYIPAYIELWASYGDISLFLNNNAFLNSNISGFVSVLDTADTIQSNADYFGITNTLDTASRYLDNADNLEYKSVVVTNPATFVSDSQTPSFESPIKYNSDGTFEFLIAPDYEAKARELNYTIRYSDGVHPEEEKALKIVINDVID